MKIAIPSMGEKENSTISPTFARAEYFIIKDTEKNKIETIKNPYITGRGVGFAVAEMLGKKEVEAVITSTIGPNAMVALKELGIKIYKGEGTVRENIEKLVKGQLEEIKNTNIRGRPGQGRGFGFRRRWMN